MTPRDEFAKNLMDVIFYYQKAWMEEVKDNLFSGFYENSYLSVDEANKTAERIKNLFLDKWSPKDDT